ncbi:MAG: type II toxin-antitoxin system prevent-host-death family antitoxin [Oceanicaulis sp.]
MSLIFSFSEARAKLKALMDQVTTDRAPAIITRRGAEPVVMVSMAEWESLQETQHLLKSPANARRLRSSIDAADAAEVRALTPDDLQALISP